MGFTCLVAPLRFPGNNSLGFIIIMAVTFRGRVRLGFNVQLAPQLFRNIDALGFRRLVVPLRSHIIPPSHVKYGMAPMDFMLTVAVYF